MNDEHASDQTAGSRREDLFTAERAKAFIDAVVAIAMTLLILPLMESVADIAKAEEGGAQWLDEHQQQLISFVVSFAVIAMFWMNHHRLFARVERTSTALLWIAMAWLLSIVWLPVATAMTGQMSGDDAVVKGLYIGSMILTSVITLLQRWYLRAHPRLHDIPEAGLRRGMAVDLAMALLFTVALTVSILVPAVGYAALFLMFLTGPTQAVFARLIGVPRTVRG